MSLKRKYNDMSNMEEVYQIVDKFIKDNQENNFEQIVDKIYYSFSLMFSSKEDCSQIVLKILSNYN